MEKPMFEKTLQQWAKQWKTENLTEEDRRIINQANMDLYMGCHEEDYPGWEDALALIKTALKEVPSILYVDTYAEDWTENDPSMEPWEKCSECDDTPNEEGCAVCFGEGVVETCLEGWYSIERKQLVQAIVGRELVSYL
jgi:hypothetical protein